MENYVEKAVEMWKSEFEKNLTMCAKRKMVEADRPLPFYLKIIQIAPVTSDQ